jgi:hypothetical protein
MVMLIFGLLVMVSCLRTLHSWRKGILMMIFIAAIQDPMRKLVPGTPSWLALATVPVFLTVIFCSATGTPRWFGDFKREYPKIAKWLLLFCVLCLPAAALSATYGRGSWLLTIFGAFSYSLIFLALIAGYHYARSEADVRRLLGAYCLLHGVMLTGGYIEYMGWLDGWNLIGDSVLGYKWIRWEPGYIIKFIAGFYRSGDVMGWHAMAVATLSIVLAMTGRKESRRLWVFVSAFAIGALLLCGRRKMVYMLPTFGLALAWLYFQAGRSAKVIAVVGLLAIPAASVWIAADLLGEQNTSIRFYRETSGQSLDSLQEHGFGSLIDTYDQQGFFGAGLGTATPGSHNLNVERPPTWQESATSRILVELGVPGAVGFLGVMVAIILALWRLLRKLMRARAPQGHYVVGLIAYFIANVGSLTVSGQILADPFIAAFLGLLAGVALSFSRLQLAEPKAPRGRVDAIDPYFPPLPAESSG